MEKGSGLQNRRFQVRVLAAPLRTVTVAAYLLFLLAGLAFGFAAVGKWKWAPLAFPLMLALAAALTEGVDGTLVARLVVALLLTAAGVLVGTLVERRGQGGRPARYA
jgi:4-amino-4-deoxy-L-arabinose transferase-like glycosyltransferase